MICCSSSRRAAWPQLNGQPTCGRDTASLKRLLSFKTLGFLAHTTAKVRESSYDARPTLNGRAEKHVFAPIPSPWLESKPSDARTAEGPGRGSANARQDAPPEFPSGRPEEVGRTLRLFLASEESFPTYPAFRQSVFDGVITLLCYVPFRSVCFPFPFLPSSSASLSPFHATYSGRSAYSTRPKNCAVAESEGVVRVS